jgi:hypothetical protein
MVIAADMQHLIAVALVPLMPDAGSAVAHLIEIGQFLGVEVEEIARSFMLIPIVRFFFLEGSRLGSAGLSKPEAHGGARHPQLPGDPDRRLAPPSSTYGLDDESKLMASGQAMRLAGAVLKSRLALSPKTLNPFVPGPLTEPGHRRGRDDRHPGQNPFYK